MVVWLPHISADGLPYSRQWITDISVEKLNRNIAHLSTLGLRHPLVSYINSLWKEYHEVFDALATCRWIHEDEGLSRLITTDLSSRQVDATVCQKLIREMTTARDNLVFLSDSHTSTAPVIRALKVRNSSMRIGVICIDAHADLYDTTEPLWKGNVFSTLIEESSIQSVVLLGVPGFRQRSILSEIKSEMANKLSFVDWPCSDADLAEGLGILKDNCVTNIYYSIDLDGLNTREAKYTALEYCPFQILANIAHLDLEEKDITTTHSMLEGAIRPPGREMLSGVPTVKNLLYIGDAGISIDDVTHIIDQTRVFLGSTGIMSGLQHNNCRINGDIVELFGLDYESKTANAVCRIIETLSRET